LFGVLFLLAPRPGWACDICSCFMGITPYDNQSGLSLMHRYRIFNGYQDAGQTAHFFLPARGLSFPRPTTATTATTTTTTATPPISRHFGWLSCAASTSSRAASS